MKRLMKSRNRFIVWVGVVALCGALMVVQPAAARVSLGELQADIEELQNEDRAETGQLVIDTAFEDENGDLEMVVANLGGQHPRRGPGGAGPGPRGPRGPPGRARALPSSTCWTTGTAPGPW